MGVCVPEELGGAGADFVAYVSSLEELSRGRRCRRHGRGAHERCDAADRGVRDRRAEGSASSPPLARSEVLGAFALDRARLGLRRRLAPHAAVADGDAWRLSGRSSGCTNGELASTFLVFARTDPATDGARGVSAFLLDAERVEVTREEEKLGLHSSSTADLRLDDVRGRRRPAPPRGAEGVRRRDVDARRWTHRDRRTGGRHRAGRTRHGAAPTRSSASSSAARSRVPADPVRLADMATEIAAARQLTLRAAWLKQAGHPHGPEGAMANFRLPGRGRARARMRSSPRWVRLPREFPAERYYRDAKITEIYEGTSEIQRIVIARELLRGADRRLGVGASRSPASSPPGEGPGRLGA